MGPVYKAEHRRMKRVVAIKKLPKSITKSTPRCSDFNERCRPPPAWNIPTS